MVKYTLKPTQPIYFRLLSPEEFEKKSAFVKGIFSEIQKRGLEEKLRSAEPSHVKFLYKFDLSDDTDVSIFFSCTGANEGHFTQRTVHPNGYFYSDTLDFTFE